MTGILGRLEKRGLIRRVPDPADRRRAVVNVTDEGHALLRLSTEGREGKPIGSIFVLGDKDEIEPYTRPLIFNPCKGHAQSIRSIHNPEFLETLRELAALDGAFIIDSRGVVQQAGVYLDAPASKKVRVRRGLGSRHVAAAAMTASTGALAVVISESSGSITVFAKGAALLELEKPATG